MTPKRKRAQRARAGVLVLSVMVFSSASVLPLGAALPVKHPKRP